MQLKYSFKKEMMQFLRTFRLAAVILVMFSFALAYPLLFKFTSSVLDVMGSGLEDVMGGESGGNSDSSPENENSGSQSKPTSPTDIFGEIVLSIGNNANNADSSQNNASDIQPPQNSEDPMASLESMLGGMGMDSVADMYKDAGLMFATTVTTFSAGPVLVIMLLLMSAAGGEQKKRAMIVPMCSGLQYKSYLIPKFTIYPTTVFAATFLAAMTAGLLCNAMFPNNKISGTIMLLTSVLAAIYNGFIISVYLSLGLCTSKPGIMTASLYVGQMLLQSLLNGFGLRDYHPFALLNYIGGEMVMEGFDLAEKLVPIIVSSAIAIAVAVLMYFLALGVLGAKKTDNQAEKEPEF